MREHETAREKLAALLAGALTPTEEEAVRAHAAQCPACLRELEGWRRLLEALKAMPETLPAPARLGRIAALAAARRVEVLERHWNRLVLTGLIAMGWAFFAVIGPVVPLAIEWLSARLGLPWFAVAVLGLTFWWSFCVVIGLGLLPLLRGERIEWEEKVI
ncbi:MAG: zf-HC2 domain-containing protein [Acidobacteria bacterium]|nr:zf-HC2 domain-containing protein [Acidobacteriota bacterium]